jgi:hypothetical protein
MHQKVSVIKCTGQATSLDIPAADHISVHRATSIAVVYLTHNMWSQASQDGQVWIDLRRHNDDRSLSLPGQFASWPVGGLPALRAYRCFRVLLAQGPAAATMHASELSLSHFELYGWATRNQGKAGTPAWTETGTPS